MVERNSQQALVRPRTRGNAQPAERKADGDEQLPYARQPGAREQTCLRAVVVAIVAVGIVSAALWLRGMERLNSIPGWFYRPGPTGSAGVVLVVLVGACTPRLIARVRRAASAGLHKRALLALVLWGGLMQFSLHFLAPLGLEQSFERLTVGHGEFLRVAAARRGSLLETLRQYDDLFNRRQLGNFAGSKPPGTLGFYMVLDRIAQTHLAQRLLVPLLEEARRSRFVADVPEAAALAVVLLPLLTFLTIVPLVWLGSSLFGNFEAGYDAALLAYSTPALLLIDLHLDGSLFPLLGTAAVACAAHAAQTGRWPAALVGGAIAMVGAYCSFALIACFGIGVGTAFLASFSRARQSLPMKEVFAPLRTAVAFGIGALLTLSLLVVVLDFAPLQGFDKALAFHRAWKGAVPTALWRWLSLVEFGLYIGIPLVVAFLVNTGAALVRLGRGKVSTSSLYSLGVATLLGVLAWQEGTNEVARLWLFVVPFLALSITAGLHDLFQARSSSQLIVSSLCGAQLVLALVMKVRQPW